MPINSLLRWRQHITQITNEKKEKKKAKTTPVIYIFLSCRFWTWEQKYFLCHLRTEISPFLCERWMLRNSLNDPCSLRLPTQFIFKRVFLASLSGEFVFNQAPLHWTLMRNPEKISECITQCVLKSQTRQHLTADECGQGHATWMLNMCVYMVTTRKYIRLILLYALTLWWSSEWWQEHCKDKCMKTLNTWHRQVQSHSKLQCPYKFIRFFSGKKWTHK